MKCINCGAEWTVPQNIKVSVCPFCQTDLFAMQAAQLTDIGEFLQYVVKNRGKDIYLNPSQLSNLLLDLYKGEARYCNFYRRLIEEDELSTKIHALISMGNAAREHAAQDLVKTFTHDRFIDKAVAEATVGGFMIGLEMETPFDASATPESSTEPKIKSFTVNGVTFEMIEVEGGTFMMGSEDKDAHNNEKPVHQETVSTFSLGKTQVTQELWDAVMGGNPSHHKGAKKPVQLVSLTDCQYFIHKLNQLTGQKFRLPSEIEWEYAAKGGKHSWDFKYSGSDNPSTVAIYSSNNGPQNVATKIPNSLGIYDMSGNIREWTSSKFSTNYSNECEIREDTYVIRGGSYYSTYSDCRVSYRASQNISETKATTGLRLAL